MAITRIAAGGGAATVLCALLFSPFLLVGGAGPTETSTSASADAGSPVAVASGDGPWYVGGNTPPPALADVPPLGFPDTFLTPAGECTTWAAFLWAGHHGRGVTWSGDAWEWLVNAAAQGYAVSAVPSIGAIAVWPRNYIPGNDATQWGHVAVVVAVNARSYTVTEMNVVGRYRVDVRVIDLPGNQVGFIPLPADALASGVAA